MLILVYNFLFILVNLGEEETSLASKYDLALVNLVENDLIDVSSIRQMLESYRNIIVVVSFLHNLECRSLVEVTIVNLVGKEKLIVINYCD